MMAMKKYFANCTNVKTPTPTKPLSVQLLSRFTLATPWTTVGQASGPSPTSERAQIHVY